MAVFELWRNLVENFFQSVDIICSTLGLCDGLKDFWSPYGEKATAVEVSSNDTCADCTTFFGDVQRSITSKETVVGCWS